MCLHNWFPASASPSWELVFCVHVLIWILCVQVSVLTMASWLSMSWSFACLYVSCHRDMYSALLLDKLSKGQRHRVHGHRDGLHWPRKRSSLVPEWLEEVAMVFTSLRLTTLSLEIGLTMDGKIQVEIKSKQKSKLIYSVKKSMLLYSVCRWGSKYRKSLISDKRKIFKIF